MFPVADHRAGRRVASVGEKNAGRTKRSTDTSGGGKRKAAKPTRTATRRAEAPSSRAQAPSRKAEAPTRKAAAPARKASPRASTGGSFGLPSFPALVGATAVVVAAAGAISVGTATAETSLASGNIQRLSGQANVLNGASSVGNSNPLSERKQAVSRDSARMAQEDAAGEELKEVAEEKVLQRDAALQDFAARTEAYATEVAKNAWQLPLASYSLSSRFGECSALWSACHTGLDFSAPSGSPIYAVANGVVTEVGYDGSYGNKTVVQLEDGTELWYCHQSSFGVSVGETVVGGQTIGYVGSTGNSTGPHLHLEVRPGAGDPVDPYSALIAHNVNP
jgi:murein DD-endopeptidase MepM/ murein hydrolase activator NlpD